MERDEETGLEYHKARYYISWLGRWMNCDPIGIGDGVNVYAYCRNNPVGNVDGSGTQVKPKENTNWVQPVGKLPYNQGIFANTMNFLANNTVGALYNIAADVTNAIPSTYKYVNDNGGLSGVVANIMSEGERASNKIEKTVSNAIKNANNYLTNTSGKQANIDAELFYQKLGGDIFDFVKESAQAFTKLENYDIAFQLLVFHKAPKMLEPSTPLPKFNATEIKYTGKSSGRDFYLSKAGGPLLNLDWTFAKIEKKGIEDIRKHLGRLDPDKWNTAQLKRLDDIVSGKIEATDFDKRFYTHELRELERTRAIGVPDSQALTHSQWDNVHSATLEDYGLADKMEYEGKIIYTLYHPDVQKISQQE